MTESETALQVTFSFLVGVVNAQNDTHVSRYHAWCPAFLLAALISCFINQLEAWYVYVYCLKPGFDVLYFKRSASAFISNFE